MKYLLEAGSTSDTSQALESEDEGVNFGGRNEFTSSLIFIRPSGFFKVSGKVRNIRKGWNGGELHFLEPKRHPHDAIEEMQKRLRASFYVITLLGVLPDELQTVQKSSRMKDTRNPCAPYGPASTRSTKQERLRLDNREQRSRSIRTLAPSTRYEGCCRRYFITIPPKKRLASTKLTPRHHDCRPSSIPRQPRRPIDYNRAWKSDRRFAAPCVCVRRQEAAAIIEVKHREKRAGGRNIG